MGINIQSNIIITKTKKTDIEKIDFATCAEPTQTLDAYYNKQTIKPDILINGGLFTFATGKPVMDFIDETVSKSSEDWIQYGFGIDTNGNMLYAKDSDKLWKDFVSAYPPLVVNGAKPAITMGTEISGKTRRTLLGYDDTYIYTITIDSPGATLTEAATIAQNAGCKYAINLDGGGSTRLLYQGKVYAAAGYNRPVDNVIAIYFKKEQQTVTTSTFKGYRVQVGAFPTQAGADAYAQRVKNASSEFNNTFVKFVSPYYKIYSGAFKTTTEATAYMNKIKAKGFGAFVISDTINESEINNTTTTPSTNTSTSTTFTNSSLVVVKNISPNKTVNRQHAIDRITPHCVVGQCTAEALGVLFSKSSYQASSNYGVDKDGRVGMYVEEKDRSWCSSSTANDDRAITIECASDATAPYAFNDKCYATLINLCIDICRRYNKTKLLWFDNKDFALSYQPKENEMILTVHRWFANKSCPGDWMYARMGDLAARVTAALNVVSTTPTQPVEEEDDGEMTQEKFNKMMDKWLAEQAQKEPAAWSKDARTWAESKGYITGDENGNKMYKKPITREELVQVLYRMKG